MWAGAAEATGGRCRLQKVLEGGRVFEEATRHEIDDLGGTGGNSGNSVEGSGPRDRAS